MRLPLSWLQEFVNVTITAEELAERLTLAGIEVSAIHYIGVPQGDIPKGMTALPSHHLIWARDKILLCGISEVKAHPNADRLVLAMVDYGAGRLEQVVTGAYNLLPYKDKGPLDQPLLAALALEGAELYDAYSDEDQRMVLKERILRGIPNTSMLCSPKELGINSSHDGILLLNDLHDQPVVGTPLVDILGDVIFDLDLTPNMGRVYSILGCAREVAALTGQTLREPLYDVTMTGSPIEGQFEIQIHNPELNPRMMYMLIRDITIKPSPQWLQRRLQAVGTRAINNIVDITNYVMFEMGQPTHVFDYDVLLARNNGKPPIITTRKAANGEMLVTLDGIERILDDQTVIICDMAGPLSLSGIMGGQESGINPNTRNVLLEVACWNITNIRRTMMKQKMSTEASLRYTKGIHPAQSERGIRRAAELMRLYGDGIVEYGIIDNYPLPQPVIHVDFSLQQVERLLGYSFKVEEVAEILRRLQFNVVVSRDEIIHVAVPDHRVDIGTGTIGVADLCEEIARIYGYDHLPNTLIDDVLPSQENNIPLIREQQLRELLVEMGLHESINYRLTSPEAESRLNIFQQSSHSYSHEYVVIANPISSDKTVLRRTLLNGLLSNVYNNQHHHKEQKLFEIGSVFIPVADQLLPNEPVYLAIVLTGRRERQYASQPPGPMMDFFDLKGMLNQLEHSLRIPLLEFKPSTHNTFYPGRCASLYIGSKYIGVIGELHPQICEAYELIQPVVAAEIELTELLVDMPVIDKIKPIPTYPAVYQDIAVIVDRQILAIEIETAIRRAGGEILQSIRLFDVYEGESVPVGKKSLAYSLTYQVDSRTLTNQEVSRRHQEIAKALEYQFHATLRTPNQGSMD